MIVLILAFALAGCTTIQHAAARDPLYCERDARCAMYRSERANDCATQCVDDPECMSRCFSFRRGIDRTVP